MGQILRWGSLQLRQSLVNGLYLEWTRTLVFYTIGWTCDLILNPMTWGETGNYQFWDSQHRLLKPAIANNYFHMTGRHLTLENSPWPMISSHQVIQNFVLTVRS